jgi:hypothetical protein
MGGREEKAKDQKGTKGKEKKEKKFFWNAS